MFLYKLFSRFSLKVSDDIIFRVSKEQKWDIDKKKMSRAIFMNHDKEIYNSDKKITSRTYGR